jgi:hypothetical protein
MGGHVCRSCAGTLTCETNTSPTFSIVVADVKKLQRECLQVETDLFDSFNAFCFKCRSITMSVPDVEQEEQICYLRMQVNLFQQLLACGLVCSIPLHESDAADTSPPVVEPVVVSATAVLPGMASTGTVPVVEAVAVVLC